jgi:hypothetical protein
MRGLKKILDAGETKHFIAYVKKSYTDNGKGHLNHQDHYSIIIQDNILLAFPNAEVLQLL